MPKIKIGLLTIATGKYNQFVRALYASAKKYFFSDHDVTYFLFTDSKQFTNEDAVTVLPIMHEPWPLIALKKYHFFTRYQVALSEMDYLFYCDADMLFVPACGEEMLPDTPSGLVGTEHPSFCLRPRAETRFDAFLKRRGWGHYRVVHKRIRGTYETNPRSTAYVGADKGNIYFAGAFCGGTTEAFLAMSLQIRDNINLDLMYNLIAVWHDESHLNRYFIDHPPKVLTPSYCYPKSWQLPYKKILLALNKNNAEVRRGSDQSIFEHYLFTKRNCHPSQTIVLAGSGRSGTTWLGNIISANFNISLIFEPFHYPYAPQAAVLPFRAYARPRENYPQWQPFVEQALCGQVQNNWILRQSRQGHRWWAYKRLVKTIRANLMLAWIDRIFHPRIVFITRHPCAVILSRIKLGWKAHLDVFLKQPQLMADYLDPFVELIEEAKSDVQKHAVMWCIENLIPLRQSQDDSLPFGSNWLFCTYEQLYCHPQAETNRILRHLGIRKTYFTQRAIKRHSITSRRGSALLNGQNPLVEWQNKLSKQEIEDILKIVEGFGIELYNSDPMPNLTGLHPNL